MPNPAADTSDFTSLGAQRDADPGGRGRAATGGASPIRVLHVIASLGRQARTGGTEYGLIKLVNALERSAVSSAICSGCHVHPHIAGLLAPDVALFECGRAEPRNDLKLVRGLLKAIRVFRPDIVHTHGWGTLCDGLLASRLGRVPAMIHGEHGTLQTRAYQLRIQRWAWHRVDQVVCVSSRLAERVSREVGFPLDRIRTIRNGVNLDRFNPRHRPDGRALLNLDSADLVVGAVGRLVPVKDQLTFIRALAVLRDRRVPAKGLIVGDGPLRAVLEQEIQQRSLGGSVQVLGHRPDVERVFAALDVFVLSSISEGLSNTIQEALASGVPVVATHVGGADELVGDGRHGYLVRPRDPEAMADAIQQLVERPAARRAMAAAARRRAEEEFGVDNMLRGYQEMYVTIGAERARARSDNRP